MKWRIVYGVKSYCKELYLDIARASGKVFPERQKLIRIPEAYGIDQLFDSGELTWDHITPVHVGPSSRDLKGRYSEVE